MKTIKYLLIAALVLISFGVINNRASAQINADVSFNVFYESLRPHGSWFNYGEFGMCWRPFGVSINWEPYRDGHWVWTDYGWTWVSDYSWGWAPFHYGRWTFDDHYGWIWVPDYEWSPAWVQWRYDADYIGWAPLPPRVRFNLSIGFDVDDYGVSYHHWNYIYNRDMVNARYRFIPRHRLFKIHRHTTNITNITIVNNHIYNYGPRINDIERASGSRVRQYNIINEKEFSRDKNNYRVDNNNLHVYRPEVTRTSGSTRGNENPRVETNRNNPAVSNTPAEKTDRNAVRSNNTPEKTIDRGNRSNSNNRPEVKESEKKNIERNVNRSSERQNRQGVESRKEVKTRESERSKNSENKERNRNR